MFEIGVSFPFPFATAPAPDRLSSLVVSGPEWEDGSRLSASRLPQWRMMLTDLSRHHQGTAEMRRVRRSQDVDAMMML